MIQVWFDFACKWGFWSCGGAFAITAPFVIVTQMYSGLVSVHNVPTHASVLQGQLDIVIGHLQPSFANAAQL